ncbi:MAG: hypothetical protein IPN29_21785 [Saprospiraceae bacterium]|nr:hypothetical protein [Saprospiraceae bacterium]
MEEGKVVSLAFKFLTAVNIKKERLIFFAFLACLIFLKFGFHEFWKDEWQAWLVARDMSLSQMLSFLNYEGHPSLWYLYLKGWTVFSNLIAEDMLLNFAHLIPVALSLFLLFERFEMPLRDKIFIAASYFIFFEYGGVNRGYALVVMLSILYLVLSKGNHKWWPSIILLLIFQTEVYGAMIALVLLFYGVYQYGFNANKNSLLLGSLGLLLFVLTVYPRGNEDDFSRAYQEQLFSLENLGLAFQGLLANTFGIGLIADTSASGLSGFGLVLSAICLVLTSLVFMEDRKILITWLLGLAGFILFCTMIYNGGIRQWGMLFLLFVLLREMSALKVGTPDARTSWLVIALCLAPLVHNLRACYKEITLNFSNAKDAAAFVAEKIPENVPIVSLNKFETAAAGAYARRKFYELPTGEPFTYFKWLEKVYLPTQSELILFAKYKKAKGLIIISPNPVDEKRFPLLRLWKKFDAENFKSEDFYFYVLDLSKGLS